MSVNPRGLTRSPSPSTAAPSPKRQKLSDQAGPSSASSSRTAHQPPPPPAATSFPSTSSTSLPVTFPSSTSTTGAVEDEPAAQALGTVQPNGAGVTKVNGADGIDLSNGSSSSARVNTDDVLLGSKEVGVDGSNGGSAMTGTSETQLKQKDEKEESDDEEVEELPEPEKEEMDTSHGDMYLDTVRTPILSPRALFFILPSCLLLAFPQVARQNLEFDFERLCSKSMTNINVYCCLVCGKYFQGRGRGSWAYRHAVGENHRVWLNLGTEKVGSRP
jgi:hypothetical protein